jgi:hypothetical protein
VESTELFNELHFSKLYVTKNAPVNKIIFMQERETVIDRFLFLKRMKDRIFHRKEDAGLYRENRAHRS